MKKEEINNEFISKIEIKIEDTLFYMPGESIKGLIILNPKYQIKLNDTTLHLTLKIMQYEFWDYSNKEINELKNIYITNIQTEKIIFELKQEEISIQKNYENFSIIDKEDENKIISIPFVLKINEEKILPTFQFDDSIYFLGIRHLLLVECNEYNSSNYIGLFIGKNKKKDFDISKEIKENYIVDLGSLEIKVNYPKLSYKFDEEIKLEIQTNSNLLFKKITEIQQQFYRNIKWKGYMTNTLLNKNIYQTQNYSLNKNKYGFFMKINALLLPFESSLVGGLLGLGISTSAKNLGQLFFGLPLGLLGGAGLGLYQQGKIVKDALNLNENDSNFKNDFISKIKNNNDEKLLLNEELKKFVYFKDDKIVGFIKFAKNITPPVEGYYFICEFNMKIDVQISGFIINRNKCLKTQIDIYDSEKYIAYMKKIFKY